MKNAILTTSMLAYLSCATPKTVPSQAPVVEVQNNPIIITEKPVDNVKLPSRYPPVKIAADFIVKTLEEKIKETPGAAYASGNIRIDGDSDIYRVTYTFEPTDVCKSGSDKPLTKGLLTTEFFDWKFVAHPANLGSQTLIEFKTVKPFYALESFLYFHDESPSNASTRIFSFYPTFKEARKLSEETLLYIAEELKQKPLNVKLGEDAVFIIHPNRNIGDHEESLLKSYKEFINVIPTKNQFQQEDYSTLLKPCLLP